MGNSGGSHAAQALNQAHFCAWDLVLTRFSAQL
jgi:hypothetical protein